MAEKLKPSRYNHFVPTDDNKCLAFNALSCGLAEFDKETLEKYKAFVDSKNGNNGDTDEELLKNLKMGGFLIDEDVDELDGIRAGHYKMRFGNTGFGLTLIPTYNCNFACDYCYENSELHSMTPAEGSIMSDEVCDNIVKLCEKEIAEKSTFAVTWYGGEPLMAKHIIKKLTKEFIRICDEKESKYHAGIITNGYLLSKENLDFLIDSKVTFAQVTIDGPEKIHNVRRPLKMGGKTFQRIISNVEQINDELPIKVAIRVNIDKRNVDKVPELLDDLKNRGINSKKNVAINFGQTVQYKNSCPNISLHCMASSEFAEFMIDAYNYALDCDFIISSFPALQIGSCGAVGTNSYLIEPNGNLQLCWATVGNDSYKIGSLEKDGLVYNNNYTKWLGWTPFRSNCNNCEVLPICMGGCPYKTIYKDDVIDGENNICVWWKYNLGSMLDITKEAKNKNQLIVLR